MDSQRENMVTAYLDGELSAAEAAEFDKSFTPVEKSNLAAEIKLEYAIGERLSRGAACPDLVWQRALAAIEEKASPMHRLRTRRNWMYAVAALAAALAITVGGLLINANTPAPGRPILALAKGATVESLQEEVQLRGNDTKSVNSFLKENGFNLAMSTAAAQVSHEHHAPRVLLGLSSAVNHGVDVMELMFNCCGRPLKVVIAKAGSRTAREIGDAMAEGEIQVSRHVGEYVAALVGQHEAPGLLDSLTDTEATA